MYTMSSWMMLGRIHVDYWNCKGWGKSWFLIWLMVDKLNIAFTAEE